MNAMRRCVSIFLLFPMAAALAAKTTDADKTFQTIIGLNPEELFPLTAQGLAVPDWILWRLKKDDYCMEVVQGMEAERYEPIKVLAVEVEVKENTTAARLQARKKVYQLAFATACRLYDQGEGETPVPADGFGVTFPPPSGLLVLEATITLYDLSPSTKLQVLKAIENLTRLVQSAHAAEAKYMGDMTVVTKQYVAALQAIQAEVKEFNGHRQHLRLVQERLDEIGKTLETVLQRVEKSSTEGMEALRRSLAETDRALREQLRAVQADLQRVNHD